MNSIRQTQDKQSIGQTASVGTKGSKGLYIVLGALVIAIIAGISGVTCYMISENKKEDTESVVTQEEDTSVTDTSTETDTGTEDTTETPTDPYEGWETYISPVYGYTIKYPSDWELTESEEIKCTGSEGDGGCYPRSKGATIEINKPNSDNKLIIEYPVGFASYAFDKNKNYQEEDFILWDESYKKGSVYCDSYAPPIDCVESKYSEVVITFYHDGLDEQASDCTDCYYPEGNIKDICGNIIDIIGRFYGGYTESEDEIYDNIVASMTDPSCSE